MTIGKRLFTFSLIPLLMSLILIAVIIFQMVGLQSSSSNDVQILLEGKELNGNFLAAKQVLSNYATNPSEANKNAIEYQLTEIENTLKLIEPELKTAEHRQWFEQIDDKYQQLTPIVKSALADTNANEVKRQSARLSGIMNDVFMLQRSGEMWYGETVAASEKKIKGIITFTVIASIILVLVSIASIWRLTTATSRPIRKLVNQASQIADGDLTVEIDSNSSEKNEIGQLNNAFKQMVENLKRTVHTVQSIGVQVQEFSTELTEEMNILNQSASQVSTSTEELATGSLSISEEIQDVASNMDQMTKNIERNTESGKLSTESSELTLLSVEEGQSYIEQQRLVLDRSTESTKSIVSSVQSFVDYTKQIEETARLVNDIADQTNLLALNAAIEAARAGEQGKGFAVVAEEVRKLADESTTATTQIFEMVKNIQIGINHMEKITNQTVALSSEQEESMNHTTDAFTTIKENVTTISTQLQQLTADMTVSNEMSVNVGSSIQNISAVTEETAAGTEEISASAEEQQRSFKHVQEQASQLEELTDELTEQLSHFKLS